MTQNTTTVEPKQDEPAALDHKRNRKEVIALGFQNKTRGEAAFNAISYIGFGYFLVTAVSVFATWLMRDAPLTSKLFEKYISEPITKRTKIDSSIMNIVTLFIGGTIASVLPVKWFEDNKPKFVKKLDYVLYKEEEFKHDPKIQAAHQELEEMPKQTWLSVFGSRVVAFVATFAVFFAIGGNKSPFAKFTKELNIPKGWDGFSLDKMAIKGGRWLDGKLSKNVIGATDDIAAALKTNELRMDKAVYGEAKALAGHEVVRPDPNKDTLPGDRIPTRIYNYIALDALYTVITSATLWVSTRFFGALVGKDAKTAAAEEALKQQKKKAHSEFSAPHTTPSARSDADPEKESDTPPTRITSPTHLERVVEPQRGAELTA